MYRVDFIAGSRHLDKLLGAANTCILMTSSLTMALAVVALQRRNKRLCIAMLSVTLLFGVVFLGNKAQEWAHKFELDLYPKSETMLAHPQGEQIFFGMYYAMTGLHALHIIIGGIAIATALVFVLKGRIRPERAVMIENVGLYWHLVDVIWIFLFPMFYLIS
jgi:cytochrome c oxidase subunit 3